jgi:hypothetical protein
MTARGLSVLLVLMPLAGCDAGSDLPNVAEPAVSSRVEPNDSNDVVLPPHRALPPNPLGLPFPETESMAKGDRVYAVVRQSLLDAALGKTLVLRLSRVVGREGEQVLVRQPSGVPYAIHPAYVVPLRRGRFRRRGSVLAPRGGRMTHAVVRTFRRKKIVVQYTDVGLRLGQQAIARNQLGTLTGDDVLVAWRGLMTPGVIRKVEPSGLMSVKRPLFGRLTIAGPGMVLLR